jgi:hypothetical protein
MGAKTLPAILEANLTAQADFVEATALEGLMSVRSELHSPLRMHSCLARRRDL